MALKTVRALRFSAQSCTRKIVAPRSAAATLAAIVGINQLLDADEDGQTVIAQDAHPFQRGEILRFRLAEADPWIEDEPRA